MHYGDVNSVSTAQEEVGGTNLPLEEVCRLCIGDEDDPALARTSGSSDETSIDTFSIDQSFVDVAEGLSLESFDQSKDDSEPLQRDLEYRRQKLMMTGEVQMPSEGNDIAIRDCQTEDCPVSHQKDSIITTSQIFRNDGSVETREEVVFRDGSKQITVTTKTYVSAKFLGNDQALNPDEQKMKAKATDHPNVKRPSVTKASQKLTESERIALERSVELPDHFVVLQYHGRTGPTTGTDVWRHSRVRSKKYRATDIQNQKQALCDKLKVVKNIDVEVSDIEFVIPLTDMQECVKLLQQEPTCKTYKRLDSQSKMRYYHVADNSSILQDLRGRKDNWKKKPKKSGSNRVHKVHAPPVAPQEAKKPRSNQVKKVHHPLITPKPFAAEEEELEKWIGQNETRLRASRTFKKQLVLQRAILQEAKDFDAATKLKLKLRCELALRLAWDLMEVQYNNEQVQSSDSQHGDSELIGDNMYSGDCYPMPYQSNLFGVEEGGTSGQAFRGADVNIGKEKQSNFSNSPPAQSSQTSTAEEGAVHQAFQERKKRKLSRTVAIGALILSICAIIISSVVTTRGSQNKEVPSTSPPLVGTPHSPTKLRAGRGLMTSRFQINLWDCTRQRAPPETGIGGPGPTPEPIPEPTPRKVYLSHDPNRFPIIPGPTPEPTPSPTRFPTQFPTGRRTPSPTPRPTRFLEEL